MTLCVQSQRPQYVILFFIICLGYSLNKKKSQYDAFVLVCCASFLFLTCIHTFSQHILPSFPFFSKYHHFWLQKNKITTTIIPKLRLQNGSHQTKCVTSQLLYAWATHRLPFVIAEGCSGAVCRPAGSTQGKKKKKANLF